MIAAGNTGLRVLRLIIVGLLLALAALPAWALGLGPIKVKSQPGQPLLAEIPIITSDPEELRGLQARLASPDVFRRIGLQAPEGIVSDLQFQLVVDDAGQPLIRVTTPVPVQQPALTFLVEVDWGQGRLVREYTALVSTPRTIDSPAAPVVQAPAPALPALVMRPEPPQPVPDAPQATTPPSEPVPAAAQAQPSLTPAAAAPTPRAVAAKEPSTQADRHRVQQGETLSGIASRLRGEASLDQMMVALLQANPDAFIGGDMNLVRANAVLRVPDRQSLAAVDPVQASALVRSHVEQWRAARRQRMAAASTAAVADNQPAAQAQADAVTGTTGSAAAAASMAGARLEIAPPGADSATAGTQSGLQAGGEGDMLRQELQETLAARDSEVAELKARIAELEQLSKDQSQLIALKDNQLAQVQQNVAQQDAGSATAGIWWWALPLLLLVGVIAWLFARRRPAPAPAGGYLGRTPAPGRARGSALAGAMASTPLAETITEPDAVVDTDAPLQPTAVVDDTTTAKAPVADIEAAAVAVERVDDTRAETSVDETPVGEARAETDAGHATDVDVLAEQKPESASAPDRVLPGWGAAPAAASAAKDAPVPDKGLSRDIDDSGPAWHSDPSFADALAPLSPAPAGSDRIELARAYLDLGDRQTAESLLREVAEGGNPDAAAEARELLAKLG